MGGGEGVNRPSNKFAQSAFQREQKKREIKKKGRFRLVSVTKRINNRNRNESATLVPQREEKKLRKSKIYFFY